MSAIISDSRDVMLEMEEQAYYQDGLVTMPAFLFERLYNILFPNCQKHEYTTKD